MGVDERNEIKHTRVLDKNTSRRKALGEEAPSYSGLSAGLTPSKVPEHPAW